MSVKFYGKYLAVVWSLFLEMLIVDMQIVQGPAQDEVIAKLRHAFMEIAEEYKRYTDQEKAQVCCRSFSNLGYKLACLCK